MSIISVSFLGLILALGRKSNYNYFVYYIFIIATNKLLFIDRQCVYTYNSMLLLADALGL